MRFSGHKLIRLLDAHTFVWLAQFATGAYRAVGFLYRNSMNSRDPYDRAYRDVKEFAPISRTHENLVHILQVGRNEEAHYSYYAMEAADDKITGQQITPASYRVRSLYGHVSPQRFARFDDCLKVCLCLASAVGHLHQRGLIHANIRLSNVIFVNGVPKLAGIGLAINDETQSCFGGISPYRAPEYKSTPQANVYSLGLLFYELITGKDRRDFPELPEDWGNGLDISQFRQLNRIILEACDEDPRNRQQSATELYDDMALLQSGKSSA